jgi:hypothetical protein
LYIIVFFLKIKTKGYVLSNVHIFAQIISTLLRR